MLFVKHSKANDLTCVQFSNLTVVDFKIQK